MRIPPHILDQARNLAESDQLMEYFVKFYDSVTSNSVYESYITRRNYLDRWNKELEEKEVELINTATVKDTVMPENVVLLHDKAVDRAMKYFEGQLEFLKDTEAIRQMLTPEEVELTKADRKSIRNIAI